MNLSHLPDIQQALHLSDNHVEYLDDEIEDHSYLFVVQFFYIQKEPLYLQMKHICLQFFQKYGSNLIFRSKFMHH